MATSSEMSRQKNCSLLQIVGTVVAEAAHLMEGAFVEGTSTTSRSLLIPLRRSLGAPFAVEASRCRPCCSRWRLKPSPIERTGIAWGNKHRRPAAHGLGLHC